MPTEPQRRDRSEQINIRLTPGEAAELRDQAHRRGMSLVRLILEAVRYVARLPYNAGFGRPDAAEDGTHHHNT
jgi:predicted HicB family RNase H-like nuclease